MTFQVPWIAGWPKKQVVGYAHEAKFRSIGLSKHDGTSCLQSFYDNGIIVGDEILIHLGARSRANTFCVCEVLD